MSERDYTVTAPDGRRITVRAPVDASDDQLIALAQSQAQPRAAATFGQKVLASAPIRAVKGMKDPLDAGAQLLPRGLSAVASVGGLFPNRVSEFLDSEATRIDSDVKASENEYQAARWATGQDGFDGMRMVGNVASPANLAIAARVPQAATTLGRVGAGAVAGGMGGLMTPVTDTSETSFGMQKVGQTGVGALGGAVVTPIAGKVFDLVAPRVKALMARMMPSDKFQQEVSREAQTAVQTVMREMDITDGQFTPAMQKRLADEVARSLRAGKKLDAAALLRKMDFEAQEVPYLGPQITRDPQGYSRAMNLRGVEGVGEPIAARLQAQNQKITSDIAKFGGGRAQERFAAGQDFIEALQKVDDSMGETVRRAYTNARASAGKDWDVPLQGLSQDAQRVVDDFGVGAERNALPSAVYARLKQLGIVGDGMEQKRVFNYEEADKLLKQINSHMQGGENGSLKALHKAVKDALTQEGAPGDPFAVPRKLAAERFRLMEAIPALDAVAKGKAVPDDFVQRFVVGGKTQEVQRLAKLLPDAQREEARRQIAEHIQRATFQANAAGDKLASPAGIQKVLRELGSEKLKAFFSAQEIAELQRLARVTSYANSEPAWGTVARGGNPGGVLFGALARTGGIPSAVGQALPLIGPLRQGLDARAVLRQNVPSTANLSPKEIAAVSKAMGLLGMSSGGLLAPGP